VPQSTSILLLGGAKSEASRLRRALARHFLLVEAAPDFDEARELLRRCLFHVLVLVDPQLPWTRLREACNACEGLPSAILLIAGKNRVESAVSALRGGVSDVLLRPFSTQELVTTINELGARRTLPPQSPATRSRRMLVGDTPRMRELRELIGRIGPSGSTVLIEGEAGTGKELLARLLHERSGREGPFVPVDCGAGHVRENLFAAAAHGTLFLDGVSELSADRQDELLRALETHVRHPVAADQELPGACRVVASSRGGLAEGLRQGRFREDLYCWLSATRIVIPPLRERGEDIGVLAAFFMERLSDKCGLPAVNLERAQLSMLEKHDWPGNVTELREVVKQTLLLGWLPPDALGARASPARLPAYPQEWTLEQVKNHHMARVLEASGGNKSAAARRLGISRKTLERKLGKGGRKQRRKS
jgi:DNA-binding NtrC family response regulator